MKSLGKTLPAFKNRISGITFGTLSELSQVFLLILSMWLIVRAAEQPPILFLTFAIVGVRAFALGRAALRYVERLLSHDVAFKQLTKLREWSFEGLIPITPVGIEDKSRGEIMSRLVDDLDQLQDEILRFRNPLIISLVSTGASLIIVAFISLPGALIITAGILVFGSIGALLTHYVTIPATYKQASLKGEIYEEVLERTENALELEVYGALKQKEERIQTLDKALSKQQISTAFLNGASASIVMFGAGLITLTLLHFAFNEQLSFTSAPVLAAVVMAPAAIYELMNMIPLALQSRALVRESAKRVDELVTSELPREIPNDEPSRTKKIDLVDPETLDFVNVAAHYPKSQRPALESTNFSLQRGDTLIIRGASGSGKSTIARVLVRFLNYSGSIKLGDAELRDLPFEVVRKNIGYSEQRPHIFEGTLRDNLQIAKPGSTDETLIKVLEKVGLYEWAEKREGLGTQLGVSGSLVSGGQAQRIALARLLLADFPIVVFDEPTSEVDPDMAQKIVDEIMAVMAGKTVILITHDTTLRLPESAKILNF